MPIFVTPTNPDPTAPPIVIPTPAPLNGSDVTWTSPAGKVTLLSNWQSFNKGVLVRKGLLGLGMPDYTFYTDQSPAYDGEIVRGVRANPKEITIPVHVYGRDRPECLDVFHELVDDFDPQLGMGQIKISEADGSYRTIGAYYSSGLEGQDDDDAWGRTWMSAAIVFRVPTPFWEGEEYHITWELSGTPGSFYPILPLKVKNSQLVGEVTAANKGNVRAFPIWESTGPYTNFTAENQTTDKRFFIDKALILGDTSVVDTRQGIKSAYLNGTTNLWEWMDIDSSELWALEPGDNDVVLTAPAATSASKVTMRYRPRWKTAY